jgi:hypothetical protein
VSHTVMTFVGHWPLTSRSNNCFLNSIYLVHKSYGSDKLRWEEAEEAEEKIRLKQYISLCSKGRHNNNQIWAWLVYFDQIHCETNFKWTLFIEQKPAIFLDRTTIRRCVTYHNDLCGTLTSRSNNCFLNSIFLSGP